MDNDFENEDNDGGPVELNDAGPADRQQDPKGRKPNWKNRQQIASIRNHFNIFRSEDSEHEGEVTVDEQLKAMERFIRWHTRQVEVGRKLHGQLMRYKQFQEGTPNAKSKAS